MNNKVNILEEMNKMKNLINAKAGMVISEQETGLDADVKAFRDEISNNSASLQNVDEKKLVNILKKYATDRNTFKSFEDKFVEKYTVKPTEIMAKSLDYSNDVAEINDLNSALSKIGLRYTNSGGIAKFEELSAVRQRNINANYCRVKDGKVVFPGSAYNGKEWKIYVSGNKVTPEEIAAAKATCPQVVVPDVAPSSDGKAPAETLKQTGPTPTQRLAATAKSLGVENPKMDVATLQTILNTLNQGPQGVTESKNSVNEELNMMKYLLGYQRGKVISEQDAPATPAPATASTPKDLITLIQTVLNDKFKQPLGPTGADGRWGKFSQDALENALKAIKSGSALKQATPETEVGAEATTPTSSDAQGAVPTQLRYASSSLTTPAATTSSATPAATTTTDIYTTLVNNKTLQTRDNGNKIVYKGADLTSNQRQELESKLQGMGYRVSRENNDIKQGDKIVFKKN